MHYLFLSPHYDDAVYSCGGTLASLTTAGNRVTVLTVCAGSPPNTELSSFAEQLHKRWGLSNTQAVQAMVDIRRQEDQAALKIVGVKSHYLDVPDCIYRRGGEQDRWLYASEEALFRKLNVVENKLISDITQKLVAYVKILSAHSKDIVRTVAPLAIGNHVDHQLVRSAAERAFGADTLTYYQDFPYVLKKEQILAYETSADWHSAITELDERAINCKVAAIAAYESQISTFWENRQVLEAEVKAAVRNWGNGELFWRFSSIA